MGNKDSIVTQSNLQIVDKLQLMHLGEVTLMKNKQGFCLLKMFCFSDNFLMQEKLRKIKTRINKLSANNHVLNIYSVNKLQKKQICANNYQLQVYIEKYQSTLSEMMNKRLKQKINFQEKQLFQFLLKVVQSLIYIQDNGLKNIQIDGEAIVYCQKSIKILDCGIASSKSYDNLLSERQKRIYSTNNRFYLAPQLLKDLVQINYDPYISPKADIFSLGMLLFEMVILQPLNGYYNYNTASIDYQSLIHRLSRINHSLNLKTLLAQMLQFDSDQRIGLISLRQKLQKLTNLNTQSMPRSKSSKMLKEFLSQSRHSNFSSKNGQSNTNSTLKRQQSTQRRNKIQPYVSGSSYKSSRQLFDQPLKQKNEKQAQKFSLIPSQKSQLIINRQIINPKNSLQTNIDCSQFKNIVKNKLTKNKIKQKQNENDIQSIINNKQNDHIKLQSNYQIKNVLQIRHMNHYQSSFKKNHTETYLQPKEYNLSNYNQNSLKKVVQDNKIQKILKHDNLDNKKINMQQMQQSIKYTSRFGCTQPMQTYNMLKQSMKKSEKKKVSEVYVDEENQMELQEEIKKLEEDSKIIDDNKENYKQLNKVMTFNKQFLLPTRSIQKYEEQNSQKQYNDIKMISNIAQNYLSNQQDLLQSKFEQMQESPNIKMIKDVPVVISQEKELQQRQKQIEQSKFGKLQRQLNMMNYVDSIDQDSSHYNSLLNSSSKVISNYKFQRSQADYSSIKNQSYNFVDFNQNNGFMKKGKFKKPNLNIQINDQQNYYSGQPYKVERIQLNPSNNDYIIEQSIKSKYKQTYKPQVSELSPNFIDLSPITGYNDMKNSQFNSLNRVKEFSIKKLQTNQNTGVLFNKIVLKSGALYQGQLSKQGIPHGNGIIQNQNNFKYSGSFREGKFNGFGTLFNLKSSFQFVDFKYIDLSLGYWAKYQGQFDNGLKNGFGTVFFSSGQKFSGCWRKDIIEGYGCFYKKGGQIISGLWSQNAFKKI